jgi:uncharacterized protein (TIGR02453 family)
MLAILSAVNDVLRAVSPDCVTEPSKALMRMNRDVRFSKDKSPYRTSMGARFGRGGGKAAEAGGYYVAISPAGVEVAGGAHLLEPDRLAVLRKTLAKDARAFRRLAEDRALVEAMGDLQGERLVRVPKEFPADHPDGDLLRLKQAYFFATLPASLATSPRLVGEITRRIRLVAPFVNHLALVLDGKRRR